MHIVFRLLCVTLMYGFNVPMKRIAELLPLFIINEQYMYFMYINYFVNGIKNTLFINMLLIGYYATTCILASDFYNTISNYWRFVTDFIRTHQIEEDYERMMFIPNALHKVDILKEKIKNEFMIRIMGKREIDEFIENDSCDETDDAVDVEKIINSSEIQQILNSKGFQKMLNRMIK